MAIRMAPPTPPPATLLRMVVISSEPPPVAALPIMLWRIVPPKPPPTIPAMEFPTVPRLFFFHGCTRHVAPDCTADCFNNQADDVHRFGFLFCSALCCRDWSADQSRRKRKPASQVCRRLTCDRTPAPICKIRQAVPAELFRHSPPASLALLCAARCSSKRSHSGRPNN